MYIINDNPIISAQMNIMSLHFNDYLEKSWKKCFLGEKYKYSYAKF